jgi:hypothetical protein
MYWMPRAFDYVVVDAPHPKYRPKDRPSQLFVLMMLFSPILMALISVALIK